MKCPECGSTDFVARTAPKDHLIIWEDEEENFSILPEEHDEGYLCPSFWDDIDTVRCAKCQRIVPLNQIDKDKEPMRE
jgi:predicted RNA-binding Zn-ribbon protein involved in translation (DUF1610 family)